MSIRCWDEETRFRLNLRRMIEVIILNQNDRLIDEQIDTIIEQAHENGITSYNDWMAWVTNNDKKVKKNAKPKRTRTSPDMAPKQDG